MATITRKKLNRAEFQRECREFVDREVGCCQTALVDRLLSDGVFSLEDVQNHHEAQDIMEWWIVSDQLERRLKEKGHPFLENSYGRWWGRCVSGQAVLMDNDIREIVKELMDVELT